MSIIGSARDPQSVSASVALTDSTGGSSGNTMAAGAGVYTLTFNHKISAGTGALDAVTEYVIGHRFKILGWSAVTDIVGVGAGASRVYNMEIETTDVGTVPSTLTLTEAGTNAIGKLTAGTAVSGANVGTAAQKFSIEAAAGGTAFTGGNVTFIVQVQNMDTADALSSLATRGGGAKFNELLAALKRPTS